MEARGELGSGARGRHLGYAAALGSGAIWGLDGVLLGIALGMAPFTGGVSLAVAALAAAAMHDSLAGCWLLVYDTATHRRRHLWPALRSRSGAIVCVAALLGGPLAMSGYVLGIAFAGAAPTLAISAAYPAVGALLAGVFLHERVTRRLWLGIAACVLGAVVVSYSAASGLGPRPGLGMALAGLAAVGWGGESVLAARAMRTIDPAVAITLREFTSAAIYLAVILPAAAAYGVAAAAVDHLSFLLLCLVALAGATAYLLMYWAVKRLGVGRAMPLNVTYALWGIVFAVLFTGLRPGWTLVAGAALTVLGATFIVSEPGSSSAAVDSGVATAAIEP